MIVINCRYEKGNCIPERELTPEEKKTVTGQASNAANNTITYYQGDGPKPVYIPKHQLTEYYLSMGPEEKAEFLDMLRSDLNITNQLNETK